MAILRTDADGLALTDNSGNGLVYTTGSVLQVVSTFTTSNTSTNSTSFISTNLNLSITPKSSSNKILAIVSGVIQAGTGVQSHAILSLRRGSTNIGDGTWGLSEHFTSVNSGPPEVPVSFNYLDSPNTTGTTTYTVTLRMLGSGGSSVSFPLAGRRGVLTLMEIRG